MSTALDIVECFEFAKKLTLEAGKIIISNFENEKTVQIKDKYWENIVTEYDYKVEDLLIKELMKKFPDHKFIAEETTTNEVLELTDEPTWIIDPIDGTINFMHTFPLICISVGLVVCKEPVMGIIYNPIYSELYSAIKGKGAFLNGKRIYSSKITELEKSLLIHDSMVIRLIKDTKEQDIIKNRTAMFYNTVYSIRSIGSAALAMAYVARGAADCYHQEYPLQSWDIAAGTVIIREAGGAVISTKGDAFDIMKPLVLAASNEILARKMSKLIVDIDSETERKRLQRA